MVCILVLAPSQHTTTVMTKVCIHRLDANGDRLLDQRCLHGWPALILHISVALEARVRNGIPRLRSAFGGTTLRRLNTLVRVRFLLAHIMRGRILHSLTRVARMASVVTVSAINKLLLRKRHETTRFQEPSSLQGTCGRECPTRTTSSLIFDRSHSALLVPIDGAWQLNVILVAMSP